MNYIEYDEMLHGKLSYPEGFEEKLAGLSIEEQLNFFRIGNGVYRRQPVEERRAGKYMANIRVDSVSDTQAIIIKDGTVAGIMIKDCYGDVVACLPEHGFVSYDEDELDGSGYKNSKFFLYLICVSEDFDKKD